MCVTVGLLPLIENPECSHILQLCFLLHLLSTCLERRPLKTAGVTWNDILSLMGGGGGNPAAAYNWHHVGYQTGGLIEGHVRISYDEFLM